MVNAASTKKFPRIALENAFYVIVWVTVFLSYTIPNVSSIPEPFIIVPMLPMKLIIV